MQTFVAQKGRIHYHLPNTTQLIYQNTNQFTQTKINLTKLNLISQNKNNFPKYDSYSQKHNPILHSTNTNQMTGCQHHEYQRESEFSTKCPGFSRKFAQRKISKTLLNFLQLSALYNSCKHSICGAKLLYNKRHGVSHFDRVSKWIATSTILLFFDHLNAFLDPTIFSLHLTAFMLTISNWTRNCSFLSKAFIELLLKQGLHWARIFMRTMAAEIGWYLRCKCNLCFLFALLLNNTV